MRTRLILGPLLIATCSSCVPRSGHVIVVRPDRRGGVATEVPHLTPGMISTPTILVLIDWKDEPDPPGLPQCRKACVYDVPAPGSTLSVAALAEYLNNNCLALASGCSVTATGTVLKLNAGCKCILTFAVRKPDMLATSALTTSLSPAYSQDLNGTPYTSSFTVVP